VDSEGRPSKFYAAKDASVFGLAKKVSALLPFPYIVGTQQCHGPRVGPNSVQSAARPAAAERQGQIS
jgi:hypothetical protein